MTKAETPPFFVVNRQRKQVVFLGLTQYNCDHSDLAVFPYSKNKWVCAIISSLGGKRAQCY